MTTSECFRATVLCKLPLEVLAVWLRSGCMQNLGTSPRIGDNATRRRCMEPLHGNADKLFAQHRGSHASQLDGREKLGALNISKCIQERGIRMMQFFLYSLPGLPDAQTSCLHTMMISSAPYTGSLWHGQAQQGDQPYIETWLLHQERLRLT